MSDELDRASDLEQAERDHAIASARNYKAVVATGLFLYCSSEVSDGKRWCNADCRDDWENSEPARLGW